jgi:2-oxoglutarate ferredoxin oxidoreductase subunit alpha
MMRLRTIWPFPDEAVRELSSRVKAIVVPEMNLGQVALEVERASRCTAKVTRVSKVNGELFRPEEILAAIMEAAK